MRQDGIVWFRQDLRLHDNEAVIQAIQVCDKVHYIYVFDVRVWNGKTRFGFDKMSELRKQFLVESVRDLQRQLEEKGGHLHVMYGAPEDVIFEWGGKHKTSWVFCNRERTEEEVLVQDALEQNLWSIGQEIRYSRGKMLFHTADLPFPVTQTPDQFTSFRKEVEKITPVRPPFEIPSDLKSMSEQKPDEWPALPSSTEPAGDFEFRGGTQAGMERIQEYFWRTKSVEDYKQVRNGLLGSTFSSRFSPWLAAGSLSPKYIYAELKKFEDEVVSNESTYWLFFELMWRDFFRLMGKKHGNAIFQSSGYASDPRPAGRVDWDSFNKWAQGETGTPFVDACMRELNATGWLSNRGRQIAASFLVNDLGLNWLMGAQYFESQLLDYDPCSNYGNWAYIAGVGSDTRKDRYFNIKSQARKYDSQGDYVRRWIPELRMIRGFDVHQLDEVATPHSDLPQVYADPLVSSARW